VPAAPVAPPIPAPATPRLLEQPPAGTASKNPHSTAIVRPLMRIFGGGTASLVPSTSAAQPREVRRSGAAPTSDC